MNPENYGQPVYGWFTLAEELGYNFINSYKTQRRHRKTQRRHRLYINDGKGKAVEADLGS